MPAVEIGEEREGWGFPGTARKCHYFVDTMSLCGKWGFYHGYLDTSSTKSPDDCLECRRKLEARE